MTHGIPPTGPTAAAVGPVRVQTGPVRGLPFWIHQLAEYAIGLGLIAQAAQGPKTVLPVAFGGVVLISAAIVDGPMAGWKAVSRPAHRTVDIGLALAALVLAVLPWSRADVASRAVLAITAALLGVLIVSTSYAPKAVRPPRRPGDRAEDLGRQAGRLVGKGVKAYRDRRPRPDDS